MNAIEIIKQKKIVPVIVIEDVSKVEPLGNALINGNLPIAEVTFRTKAAKKAIKTFSEKFPEILTGAGTVLTTEQVDEAVNAGAKFIVAPGFNPRIVDYCIKKNITIVPGVNSPTLIELGLEKGLSIFKYFPAEASGGLKMLKAMSAPYGDIEFMPTGGINQQNILEYLSFNKVIACGGSWMVKKDLINNNKFDEIQTLCKQAVDSIK